MALTQLVADNAAISNIVAERFISRFKGLEDQLFERLVKLLRQLPQRNGRFVFDASTNKLLLRLNEVLGEVLRKEDLRAAVRDLLPEFDKIAANVQAMHGVENDIRVSAALLSDTKHRMVALTSESVVDAGYDARFSVLVKKVLYNHVNFGAEVLETERALRVLVHGEGGGKGVLARYAGQVARDALNQYEGQVHEAIAKLHGLGNSRYVGNIVQASRCQCRRWVRMGILTAKQLPSEIRMAFECGGGMIPGTTPTTFRIYRGGYNCLHSAIPTRLEPETATPTPGGCKSYCK